MRLVNIAYLVSVLHKGSFLCLTYTNESLYFTILSIIHPYVILSSMHYRIKHGPCENNNTNTFKLQKFLVSKNIKYNLPAYSSFNPTFTESLIYISKWSSEYKNKSLASQRKI